MLMALETHPFRTCLEEMSLSSCASSTQHKKLMVSGLLNFPSVSNCEVDAQTLSYSRYAGAAICTCLYFPPAVEQSG